MVTFVFQQLTLLKVVAREVVNAADFHTEPLRLSRDVSLSAGVVRVDVLDDWVQHVEKGFEDLRVGDTERAHDGVDNVVAVTLEQVEHDAEEVAGRLDLLARANEGVTGLGGCAAHKVQVVLELRDSLVRGGLQLGLRVDKASDGLNGADGRLYGELEGGDDVLQALRNVWPAAADRPFAGLDDALHHLAEHLDPKDLLAGRVHASELLERLERRRGFFPFKLDSWGGEGKKIFF